MAWDFLRRFLKLLGGKFVTKLAPRLIFFQYYDRVGMELQEQRKKLRLLYYKSPAQLLLLRLVNNQPKDSKLGISSLLEQTQENNSEVSILQVNSHQDFWDDKTVSSHYEEGLDESYSFIQMDASYVQDI